VAAALYLPLGTGKHNSIVRPAFKPAPDVADERAIDSAAFAGLGLEVRTGLPWLRLSGDWTYFTHRTKAVDDAKAAKDQKLCYRGECL
jgi:hypothetical protein